MRSPRSTSTTRRRSDRVEINLSARAGREALIAASAIAVAPLVAIGFSRFAYGLVLPEMRSDLGWSYAVAGFATTANGVGYLLGALAAAPITARLKIKRTLFVGWIALGLSLWSTGLTSLTPAVMTARALTGLLSGLVYVAAVSLSAHLASQLRISPGLSLGLLQAGVGAGIALSGIIVFGLSLQGHQSWQVVWAALGLVSLAALLPVTRMLSGVCEPQPSTEQGNTSAALSIGAMTPTIVGYFFFGLGYIAYMTFIVALLRANRAGDLTITLFWLVLGVSAIAGSIAWGVIVDRLRGGIGPAAVLGTTVVGAALPVLSDSTGAAIVSAVIFGSSFLATTTAVVVVARRILPQSTWTLGIGILTTAFGIGQSIGPALAGAIADATGGIKAGLALSCGFLVVGSVVSAIQRERREPRSRVALD